MKKRAAAVIVIIALLICTIVLAVASDNVERDYISTGSFTSCTVARADFTVSPQNFVFVNSKGFDTYAFKVYFDFTKSEPGLYVKITDVSLTGIEYDSVEWASENEISPSSPIDFAASASDGEALNYSWSAEYKVTSTEAFCKSLKLTITLMSGKSEQTAKKSVFEVPVMLSVADGLSLENAITAAQSIQNKEYYTESSLAVLNDAVSNAQALLLTVETASQDEIKAAADAVYAAIDGLVYKRADYSLINLIIEDMPDLSLYTDETVQPLNEAIDAIGYDKNITQQAEVDETARELRALIDSLEYKSADYSQINSIIEGLPDLSLYTDETVQPLNDEIAAVDYDKNITQQDEVDKTAQSLLILIDDLYPKEFYLIPSGGVTVDEECLTVMVASEDAGNLSSLLTANFGTVDVGSKVAIVYMEKVVKTYDIVIF